MSVGKIVEDGVVSTGLAARRRGSGTVDAGCVTRQTAAGVDVEVVGRRADGHAATVLDVVDAVSVTAVRPGLVTGPTLAVARRTRLPNHTA